MSVSNDMITMLLESPSCDLQVVQGAISRSTAAETIRREAGLSGGVRTWLVLTGAFVVAIGVGIGSWLALSGPPKRASKPPAWSSRATTRRAGTKPAPGKAHGSTVHGTAKLAVTLAASASVLDAIPGLDGFLLGSMTYPKESSNSLYPEQPSFSNSVSYHLTVRNDGTVPLADATVSLTVTPPPASYSVDNEGYVSPLHIDYEYPPPIQTGAQFNCPARDSFPPSGQMACRIGWEGGSLAPGRAEDMVLTVSLAENSASQPIPASTTLAVVAGAVTPGGQKVEATTSPVTVKVVKQDFTTLGRVFPPLAGHIIMRPPTSERTSFPTRSAERTRGTNGAWWRCSAGSTP